MVFPVLFSLEINIRQVAKIRATPKSQLNLIEIPKTNPNETQKPTNMTESFSPNLSGLSIIF